uniref:Na+/H+ antiporter n=1 Tax=Populus euphratica TaxID=75702 RepID=A0A1S5V981_POPEU|nr:Na+/H+ antiporter [Populus euphratica]AQN76194.1 Na+/H+ antiporter [Populus euphratica]AQN76203.1 Na+/H+ antiporter [Populus euphratica]AQN76204.1 Na+/H+ antiporter [Populus euphratica]AQN76205.1 Na+/H+ antiporter [Populus euphratica]
MNFGLRMVSEPDQAPIHSITLFVALLCACILIGHLLEKHRWINESITALAIGLCTGTLILLTTKGRSSHILLFDEQLFFIYLLPPIIFNAGFQVKKKQFFRNFMTIMLFGAVGTLISFIIISLGTAQLFKKLDIGFLDTVDYLGLGAIFSATDSVCTLQVLDQEETPLLYSLVFGEGVVNDATSIVLFNAILRFDLSHITSSSAIHLLGNFFYLFGTSTALGIASPGKSIGVSSILLVLVLVGRAASIFPLSFISNLTKKSQSDKIGFKQQIVIWWAGLMRGAVSMALAYTQFTRSGHTQLQGNAIMITSTITVVLFSTVVFGLLTKPLISFLLPRKHTMLPSDLTNLKLLNLPLLANGQESESDMNGDHIPRPVSLRMLLTTPSHTVHHFWRKFDDSFMRPVFGGRGFTAHVHDPPPERIIH